LKLQVSFAKEPCKRGDILQKRLIILRSLLIVATPYLSHSRGASSLALWMLMIPISLSVTPERQRETFVNTRMELCWRRVWSEQEEDALLFVRVCVCVCMCACACVCVSSEKSSSDDVFEQGKKKALFSDMGSHNLQQVQVDKS